jgi:hypothetical protein
MTQQGLLLLAMLIPVAAGNPKHRAEREDVQALQGTWVLQTVEWCGGKTDQPLDKAEIRGFMLQRLPEYREIRPDPKEDCITLIIKGRTCIFRERSDARWGGRQILTTKASYHLDTSKKPKVIKIRKHNVTYQYFNDFGNWSGRGVANKRAWYWIYAVEGDSLRLGYQSPGKRKNLLSKFATSQDPRVFVLTFKRENK